MGRKIIVYIAPEKVIRIVADENIPYLKGVLEPYGSVRYIEGRKIGRSDILDADAMVVGSRTTCNRALLEGTAVKFIATATIGIDHIDTGFCEKNSIRWVNAPGCNAGSVRQYIASVLAHLALRHGLTLKDRTMGIIGAGHVGKKVEVLCKLLGMNVLVNDPPRERNEGSSGFVTRQTVLKESDYVTLHVPLNKFGTDKTLDLIGEEELNMMKPGAWLFNTARGAVVDGDALKNSLGSGRLDGAVIDVWRNEPDPDPDLIRMASIATPHVAGYSADGKRNATVMVLESLASFFGLPFTEFRIPPLRAPENPGIPYDDVEKNNLKCLMKAFLHTYDVEEDDARFRQEPEKFEYLRNNYYLRREFGAFTLSSGERSPEILRIWSLL